MEKIKIKDNDNVYYEFDFHLLYSIISIIYEKSYGMKSDTLNVLKLNNPLLSIFELLTIIDILSYNKYIRTSDKSISITDNGRVFLKECFVKKFGSNLNNII